MTILRKLTILLIAALVALGSLNLAAAQSGGALHPTPPEGLESIGVGNASQLAQLGALWRDGFELGLVFSPDGATVAWHSTQYHARTIWLWDAASGQERAALEGHGGDVAVVAFSPDGARLASAGRDGTVRLWDAVNGAALAVWQSGTDDITQLVFSADGAYLMALGNPLRGDLSVRRWPTDGGAEGAAFTLAMDSVWRVVFSPDGSLLAVHGLDNRVQLWDVAAGEQRAVLSGHEGDLWGLVFSPDGALLASFGRDGTARLWETASGTSRAVLNHPDGTAVAFSSDGAQVATGGLDGVVRLWATESGDLLAELTGHSAAISELAFSPDGALLASGSGDHTVRLWQAADGTPGAILTHDTPLSGLDFSPEGGVIATFGGDWLSRSYQITLWSTASGRRLNTLPVRTAKGLRDVRFSPDGATLAALAGEFVMLYGIPAEQRPAYGTVLGHVVPSFINLRHEPNLDAPVMALVSSSEDVLVGGRDATGTFIYLVNRGGWVMGDPAYVDLAGVPYSDLPVRQP